MQINELINDSLKDFEAVDAIDVEFLTAIKTSPLTALNRGQLKEKIPLDFEAFYQTFLLDSDYFYENNETLSQRFLIKASKIARQLELNNPFSKPLISGCDRNISLYTSFSFEGIEIPLKCRFDGINIKDGYIIAPIITLDASPGGFSSEAGELNYHIKAAFYMFMAQIVFKKAFKMYFIAQEVKPPYNSAIYQVSESMRIKGESETVQLLTAAAVTRETKKPLSYGVFCNNDNGVFDLDIEDKFYNPRNFNF